MRMMAMPEAVRMTSLSKPQINHLVKLKKFPQPVRLSERRIAFVETEVLAWIKEQIRAARSLASS